jgi:hypothetical protein
MLTFKTRFNGVVYEAEVFEGKTKIDLIRRPCIADLIKAVKFLYPTAKEVKQ